MDTAEGGGGESLRTCKYSELIYPALPAPFKTTDSKSRPCCLSRSFPALSNKIPLTSFYYWFVRWVYMPRLFGLPGSLQWMFGQSWWSGALNRGSRQPSELTWITSEKRRTWKFCFRKIRNSLPSVFFLRDDPASCKSLASFGRTLDLPENH